MKTNVTQMNVSYFFGFNCNYIVFMLIINTININLREKKTIFTDYVQKQDTILLWK